VLLPWLAWAVVRTFGLEGGYPLVPAIAFTPYLAATAWVPVLVAALLRRWWVALAGVAAAVALAAAVLPRAFAGPRPEIRNGVPLRVMTSNLQLGRGDARTVVSLVREQRVDVLALEELTPVAMRRLDAAGLRRLLPYRAVEPRPGAGGTGLVSRLPLVRVPSPPVSLNRQPAARVALRDAPPVDVVAVHPPPPLRRWGHWWKDMLDALPRPAGPGGPLRVLAGDFNATLDHERFRRLLDAGYVDSADATGEGLRTTWPAGRRFPPELAIDHVLVDPRIAPRSLSVHLVPGSDHRAVVVQLTVPRLAGSPS
jgi:endonuclease/exonuclease/phosphatase (EEP) superfamily protein YafD